jgi:hypothetical protein
MAINPHFRGTVKKSSKLLDDLTAEAIKMSGMDVFYVPRTIVHEDQLYGEDTVASFNNAYEVEMYLENVDGFEGDGDLVSQFGIDVQDTATLIVSRRRFSDEITTREVDVKIPREGDLIYMPELNGNLFEIAFVEDENPFYPLGKQYSFVLKVEMFRYNGELMSTGISEIDEYQTLRQEAIDLTLTGINGTFRVGETVFDGGSLPASTNTAEVLSYTASDSLLQIIGLSGSIDGGTIEGASSGATAAVGSTADPAVDTFSIASAFDDSSEIQLDANDIFNFTDTDPFSEGNI